jgi:hypothetical protein
MIVNGQRHDNLRPTYNETTESGAPYRTHYNQLSTGLSKYPKARTFALTWFPELTSIEEAGNNSFVLLYRGYKERATKDSVKMKKPKEIIKFQRTIDTLLVKTLQKVFEKAIMKTSFGDRDIIVTHPSFYYFYTWVAAQGIICGVSEKGLFLPRTNRLIGLHEKLVEYAKSNEETDKLRLTIIKEAESLIKEYD